MVGVRTLTYVIIEKFILVFRTRCCISAREKCELFGPSAVRDLMYLL